MHSYRVEKNNTDILSGMVVGTTSRISGKGTYDWKCLRSMQWSFTFVPDIHGLSYLLLVQFWYSAASNQGDFGCKVP